ncbi:MAG TPA: TatD family hydrolase [Solirubrobacterales bacterium]|nr:TatD family hydrolase [Solirubrobacterales bacterium]
MVDTHAHLALCAPDDDELVTAAREAGVRRILTVGLGEDSNPDAVRAAGENDAVFAAVGRHPNSAGGFGDVAAGALTELAALPEVVAVGETGLDFYRDTADPEDQRRAFAAQISIARGAGKPLVIHLRDPEGSEEAVGEAFETLDREADGIPVILHCFSAGPVWAERAAERGWYCSFAGNLTYPRAEPIREAAALVPDDRVLVETDSPFLSPQPMRGRPNQPANVTATAERLAEVRDVAYGELERTVEANAATVFGW